MIFRGYSRARDGSPTFWLLPRESSPSLNKSHIDPRLSKRYPESVFLSVTRGLDSSEEAGQLWAGKPHPDLLPRLRSTSEPRTSSSSHPSTSSVDQGPGAVQERGWTTQGGQGRVPGPGYTRFPTHPGYSTPLLPTVSPPSPTCSMSSLGRVVFPGRRLPWEEEVSGQSYSPAEGRNPGLSTPAEERNSGLFLGYS